MIHTKTPPSVSGYLVASEAEGDRKAQRLELVRETAADPVRGTIETEKKKERETSYHRV